jgi:hypothetical protein
VVGQHQAKSCCLDKRNFFLTALQFRLQNQLPLKFLLNVEMASIYFENVEFYRNLVHVSFGEVDQGREPVPTLAVTNDTLDTTICARIRPLSEEENLSRHISGIGAKGSSKAIVLEPRKKFNGAPDVTVSISHVL